MGVVPQRLSLMGEATVHESGASAVPAWPPTAACGRPRAWVNDLPAAMPFLSELLPEVLPTLGWVFPHPL